MSKSKITSTSHYVVGNDYLLIYRSDDEDCYSILPGAGAPAIVSLAKAEVTKQVSLAKAEVTKQVS